MAENLPVDSSLGYTARNSIRITSHGRHNRQCAERKGRNAGAPAALASAGGFDLVSEAKASWLKLPTAE